MEKDEEISKDKEPVEVDSSASSVPVTATSSRRKKVSKKTLTIDQLPSKITHPDQVTQILAHYKVDSSVVVKVPKPSDRFVLPPVGYFTWTPEHFSVPVTVPLHPFLREFVEFLHISPSQLSPNAYSLLICLFILFKTENIAVPTPINIASILMRGRLKHQLEGTVYYLKGKTSRLIFHLEEKLLFWKDQFFYIKDPTYTARPFSILGKLKSSSVDFCNETMAKIFQLPESRRRKNLLLTESNLRKFHFLDDRQPFINTPFYPDASLTSLPPIESEGSPDMANIGANIESLDFDAVMRQKAAALTFGPQGGSAKKRQREEDKELQRTLEISKHQTHVSHLVGPSGTAFDATHVAGSQPKAPQLFDEDKQFLSDAFRSSFDTIKRFSSGADIGLPSLRDVIFDDTLANLNIKASAEAMVRAHAISQRISDHDTAMRALQKKLTDAEGREKALDENLAKSEKALKDLNDSIPELKNATAKAVLKAVCIYNWERVPDMDFSFLGKDKEVVMGPLMAEIGETLLPPSPKQQSTGQLTTKQPTDQLQHQHSTDIVSETHKQASDPVGEKSAMEPSFGCFDDVAEEGGKRGKDGDEGGEEEEDEGKRKRKRDTSAVKKPRQMKREKKDEIVLN